MSIERGFASRVCVVGAGAAGITTVKTLTEHGIPFDCFEMGSDVGGIWRYDNDNGRSAAYASLRMDTSKERVAYSDFPMPDDYPNYPTHAQVLAYFEDYVDRFDLRPAITFRTRVDRVVPTADGEYDVTVTDLDSDASTTRRYGAVLVCSGHHWDPNYPDFPGTFTGRTLHSRTYRTPEEFAGRRVLVVGIGNSGADIAAEIAEVARRTVVSTRRSAYVVPRYVVGRPADKWITPFGSRLPLGVQAVLYRLLLRLELGDQERYGIPRPEHGILATHPTISERFLAAAADGRVTVKPNVTELAGDVVRFEDGSEAAFDVVVYATGYRISFPFFDARTLPVGDNQVELYRNVVHPDRPGVYVIGLVQPLGAIMPLAERQAEWVAGLLTGELRLPDRETMRRTIADDRATLEERYVDSPRHTIQVDYYPYLRTIGREIRDGRRRARRQSGLDVSLVSDGRRTTDVDQASGHRVRT